MQTNLWEIFLLSSPSLTGTDIGKGSIILLDDGRGEKTGKKYPSSTRLIYSCSSIQKYKRADVLAENMPKFALIPEH